MKVIVDADSCPARDIIVRVCRKEQVPVLMISCLAHHLEPDEGVSIFQVDTAPQSTDMAIIRTLVPGDIVITADYGLAALALARRGRAISPRGHLFREENIGGLLEKRHLESRIRRGGGRAKGPKAFTAADRSRLEKQLTALIRQV